MRVELATLTLVAGVPPISTAAPATKPVPVTVIAVSVVVVVSVIGHVESFRCLDYKIGTSTSRIINAGR